MLVQEPRMRVWLARGLGFCQLKAALAQHVGFEGHYIYHAELGTELV
jgi:hypothetical protein